ncbi:MAG: glycosyltransferase family 2 protein [Verrucomicrobiales bacterium]|nr:glycosyltransferase family 2 protein [Verrucomicrobiales bacterium]
MKKPLVSVVMPARNAAATIGDSILSLQAQDLSEIEIILVDHGSIDATGKLMSEAAAKDPRIRVFPCEGTFVEAVNLAWERSTADLVARMDSDDVAYPARLSSQVRFLQGDPDLDACCTQVRIPKRGSETGEIIPADGGYSRYESWVNSVITARDISAQRFIDSPIPNPTMMIKRRVLESLGGYHDPPWAEDYDFWLRFLEEGYRIGKVPLPLLDWYDSPHRSTRTVPRYEQNQFQRAKAHFLSRIESLRLHGVMIWGAGPIGKQMAGLLNNEGITVHRFIEVNRKKIGNKIGGVEVVDCTDPGNLPTRPVLLSAVGNSAARERIRKEIAAIGRVEGEDFFCVA